MRPALAWVAVAIGLTVGCAGTETGNPPFAPGVGFGSHGPPMLGPVDLTVSDLWLAVQEESLIACRSGAPDVPLIDGPASVDALTGSARDLFVREIREGDYCGLRIRLGPPGGAGTPVERASVSFAGERTADRARYRVVFVEPIEIELRGRFAMTPASGGVLLVVDREKLVAGIDVSGVPAVGGTLEFDAQTLQFIRGSLGRAIALRRDLNGDGMVDMAELNATPLATQP